MAQTVPTREPASVTAGDSVTWRISLADFPASDGWTLKYRLINSAGAIDIESAAEGDDHLISEAAATSANWAAGDYTWQAYVEGGSSERYTVGTGRMTIKPDLAAQAAGYDTRTTAAKTLAAVNAWLTSRDLAVAEYEVAGRRMKYIPMAELLTLRSKLQAEVAREQAAERVALGLPSRSKVYVRF
jgi:hypothetical protein